MVSLPPSDTTPMPPGSAARNAAGEQSPRFVDSEPVHAVKRRAGDKFGDFIGLRRCADAGGEKDSRCDSRTRCKPARHDATSRFLYRASIRPWRCFGKRNLAERDRQKRYAAASLPQKTATKTICRGGGRGEAAAQYCGNSVGDFSDC